MGYASIWLDTYGHLLLGAKKTTGDRLDEVSRNVLRNRAALALRCCRETEVQGAEHTVVLHHLSHWDRLCLAAAGSLAGRPTPAQDRRSRIAAVSRPPGER
jgi:hypothetical protein